MSYLLFMMDESGHDHKNLPYEVRGGVAFHAKRLWPQALQQAEVAAFGGQLHAFKTEIKGSKLLDKDRFTWAAQADTTPDDLRHKYALAFLNRGPAKQTPTREEFTAYGQACLAFARDIFRLVQQFEGVLFAVAVPRSIERPEGFVEAEFLRKDQVFLLERYFYFLEEKREQGLIVMDETDKSADRRFVSRLQRYFTSTRTGRYRSSAIVPVPLFVASDMTYAVQTADVCIYCLNCGFRLPRSGMNAPVRVEIAQEFAPWLGRLQYEGDGYKDGNVFHNFGIVYVPDPYESRQ